MSQSIPRHRCAWGLATITAAIACTPPPSDMPSAASMDATLTDSFDASTGEAQAHVADAGEPSRLDGAREASTTQRAVPRGFAIGTRYWGVAIARVSAMTTVLEELRAHADLRDTCLEARDGSRWQILLGAGVSWEVMTDDPDAPRRIRLGLDAARAAHIPITFLLGPHRPAPTLPARLEAEARGERLCVPEMPGCYVPYAPTSRIWDAAAAWQRAMVTDILMPYLGDPVVAIYVLNEPVIPRGPWPTEVPAGSTRERYAAEQLGLLERRLVDNLRPLVGDRAEVTFKSTPYALAQDDATSAASREVFSALCDSAFDHGLMAFDGYESPTRYTLEDDYRILESVCTRGQWFLGAEVGVANAPITRNDMFRWALRLREAPQGGPSRLLGTTIFCWNCPPDGDATMLTLSLDQRRWFGEAFHAVAGDGARACSTTSLSGG